MTVNYRILVRVYCSLQRVEITEELDASYVAVKITLQSLEDVY